PVAMPPIHRPYWITSGSLRPRDLRKPASASGLLCVPMIIVATSPGRMVVTANVITEMRNSVSAIESSRLRMYVMQLFGLTLSRAAGARFAPAAGASSRAQPHFVEPQVAAVRVNDRVEPTDRGLGADRTVAEPEDHVVILVVD